MQFSTVRIFDVVSVLAWSEQFSAAVSKDKNQSSYNVQSQQTNLSNTINQSEHGKTTAKSAGKQMTQSQ